MAVERIDAQIQSLISSAEQKAQQEANKADAADASRLRAQKKIAEKKKLLKQTGVQKESFQRTNKLQGKIRQILGGSQGPEAAQATQSWGDNEQLQSKLTEAHRNQFREAMSNNPAKATKTAAALNRLTQSPEFESVDTGKQMGVIQQALIESPELEKPAGELLKSRFMKAPKADSETKNRFMDFGLRQAKKGGTDFKLGSVKHTSEMLGSMVQGGTTKGAQRAAMKMAETRPNDLGSMKNVDAFVQDPGVKKMPSFARGKATGLLAKAGGGAEVKESFTQLANNPKFQSQSPENQGRFFATVGSGRAGEFEAISNKLNQALRGADFPQRTNQVSKFLGAISQQVSTGGAREVNSAVATARAKSSGLPRPPTLLTTEGLSEEEVVQVRAQNRANVIQFYNKLTRSYDGAEKKLNKARYLEDVNSLQQLREPPALDTSSLSAKELAFVEERTASVKEKLNQVKKLQRQKARELRGKRMPPARRRALAAKRRVSGKQPQYFSPRSGSSLSAGLSSKGAGSPEAPAPAQSGLPRTPAAGARAMGGGPLAGKLGGDIQSQVASALSQLGDGPLTAEMAGKVAEVIATQVATQVASQVASQISRQLQGEVASGAVAPEPPVEGESRRAEQSGKRDGWGIPRSFERDLGGARQAPVKPRAEAPEELPDREQIVNERYTGRTLVKDPAAVRAMGLLAQSSWKGLNRSEMALLKNLGWTQQVWDTKDTPAARWPIAMATLFANLNPVQREAVRKLGFSPHDWDVRIQAGTMGKNA